MAVKSSSRTPSARNTVEPPRSGSPVAAVLVTALGVLVIAACAVLLSYNGIYQVAVQGDIDGRYAHLYPAGFTLLVLMALWTSYVLRTAPRSRRLWVDGLILALVALGAGASALQAGDRVLVPDVALVVAAVAPWVALLVAFRLFLWVVMHVRGEIPGTRPRSSREGRTERAEPDTEPAPPAVDRRQDTQPLGEVLQPETPADSGRGAEPAPAFEPDGEDPRPARETEPADFRDPGLHPPRPQPGERPTRPEHPAPAAPEPSGPGRGRRMGFLGRRRGSAREGSGDTAQPTEQAETAAGRPDTASDERDDSPTALLWPNASAVSAGGEAPRTAENGPRSADSAAAEARVTETGTEPEGPAPDAAETPTAAERERPEPGSGADPEVPPPGAAPAEVSEDTPGGTDPAPPERSVADAGPAAQATAPETAVAGWDGESGDHLTGPETYRTDAVPAAREEPTGDTPAPEAPASTAAAADDTGSATPGAPAAAPEGEGGPAERGAPELPKRTPGAAENPIKRAAPAPPTAEPASGDRHGGGDDHAASATEAPAAPQAAEDTDGFVHDLPAGDPTSDEGEPAADAPATGPAPVSAETENGDPAPAPLPSDAESHEPPRGLAYPAVPPIEKRPMVLKPRRSPRRGPASQPPEDPPSNRVRSEPTPPEE
ncbi:DUF2637 domain-containing protein [Streptomonospora litoralis]|uniref:DUF2637 domain-containing protein n=1 Tax=Streptomonospora litoralis TaxID=2498135 RepID=A0A4P6PVT6_9ACTN|nr:DUF2637 domain-containing protein [Streptomonospora litoralis]QBI52203.1 hypothetical protein EKD16_01930 [Streptomonospora litoralis]